MKKKDIRLLERIIKILQKLCISSSVGMHLQYVREWERVITSCQVVKGMMENERKKNKD